MTYNPRDYWGHPRRRLERFRRSLPRQERINLQHRLRELDPESILEVGAGWGRITRLIQSLGLADRYTCCDFTDYQRRECQEHTGILPDTWDGHTLPYEDGAFDLVLSFDVLLHVSPSNVADFLIEHARVARRWLFVATLDAKPDRELAAHCFVHDNEVLFGLAGLDVLNVRKFRHSRAHWVLVK
jgi:ubiquinone/menaquinone biosynthesis C-methylase UbiE